MKSKPKVLLLYKNSTYASYFLSGKSRLKELRGISHHSEIGRFKETHEYHFRSLSHVERTLKSRNLSYTKVRRGDPVDYRRYYFVITVGGDGTFLEAARGIKNSLILGVNSDPAWSVGNFCAARAQNFEKVLDDVLTGGPTIRYYQRIMLTFPKGFTKAVHVLNDILICHSNPAAISRYYLTIGKVREEQRSSGIWISTAVGSSGAIHSAGGRLLQPQSKKIQYRPRELYLWKNAHYTLKGGVVTLNKPLVVTSFMREGVVFVDGSHHKIPFPFGCSIKITQSPYPLKVVWS